MAASVLDVFFNSYLANININVNGCTTIEEAMEKSSKLEWPILLKKILKYDNLILKQ
jgi:hypothetical protein